MSGLATKAEIKLFINEDDAKTLISNAEITADKIKFNVTFDWIVKNAQDKTIFKLDNAGNMEIAGKLTTCSLTESMTVGSARRQFKILSSTESDNRAVIVGYDNEEESILLGWSVQHGNVPALILTGNDSHDRVGYMSPGGFATWYDFNRLMLAFDQDTGKVAFGVTKPDGSYGLWPTAASQVNKGFAYVDSSGYLRIRTS